MAVDFRVDYDEYPDWTSYEYKTAGTQSDQINRVTSPVAQKTYAMQFKVRSGDNTAANQQRAEGRADSDEQLIEGDWRWYGWSSYFESPWTVSSSFQIYTQWHCDANFSQAPMKFNCRAQSSSDLQLRLGMNTGEENAAGTSWEYNHSHVLLSSPSTDVWYDHIVGVLYDRTANGEVLIYLRNRSTEDLFTQVLHLTDVPTLIWKTVDAVDTLGDYYVKQGLYRNDLADTNIIYHDDFRYASTFEDIRADFRSYGVTQTDLTSDAVTQSELVSDAVTNSDLTSSPTSKASLI